MVVLRTIIPTNQRCSYLCECAQRFVASQIGPLKELWMRPACRIRSALSLVATPTTRRTQLSRLPTDSSATPRPDLVTKSSAARPVGFELPRTPAGDLATS